METLSLRLLGFSFFLLLLSCSTKQIGSESYKEESTRLDQNTTYVDIGEEDTFAGTHFTIYRKNTISVEKVIKDEQENTYIIGTGRNSSTRSGITIIKTDKNNNMLWKKDYGENARIIVNEIAFDRNSRKELLISGARIPFGTRTNDAYFIKIDENGEIIWSNTYGTKGYDSPSDFVEMEDGSIFFIGNSIPLNKDGISKIYLGHIGRTGKLVDEKWIDENCIAVGNAIVKTENGHLLCLGILETEEPRESIMRLYCFDSNLQELWQKDLGEASEIRRNRILPTGENDFLIMRSGGLKLMKIDGQGNKKWERTYALKDDGTISGMSGHGIQQIGPNEFILVGSKRIIDDNLKVKAILINTDAQGNIKWNKEFGSGAMSHLDEITEDGKDGYTVYGFISNLGEEDDGTKTIQLKIDKMGNPR